MITLEQGALKQTVQVCKTWTPARNSSYTCTSKATFGFYLVNLLSWVPKVARQSDVNVGFRYTFKLQRKHTDARHESTSWDVFSPCLWLQRVLESTGRSKSAVGRFVWEIDARPTHQCALDSCAQVECSQKTFGKWCREISLWAQKASKTNQTTWQAGPSDARRINRFEQKNWSKGAVVFAF